MTIRSSIESICIILASILTLQNVAPFVVPVTKTTPQLAMRQSMSIKRMSNGSCSNEDELGSFNGLDIDMIANANEYKDNVDGISKRKTPFPPYPPEVFEMSTMAEDAMTPMYFPGLKALDYFRSTRLLNERSYARKKRFSTIDEIGSTKSLVFQPTIQDVSSPPFSLVDKGWSSSWFRLSIFGMSWFLFPLVTQYFYAQTEDINLWKEQIEADLLSFIPAISLVYGAFISLTLQISYDRQRYISQQIGIETAFLTIVTQNTITIFEGDEQGVEAGQCIADHTRILVSESRATELMSMIYGDPFVRLMNLLSAKKKDQIEKTGTSDGLIDTTRDVFKDLFESRAKRLSGESSGLPPTHYALLAVLTAILLVAFALSAVPTLDSNGLPSNETNFLFSLVATTFAVFFQFALDLNAPFKGIYQVRRSAAAAQLLQNQMLLMSNPSLKGKISFYDD